MPTPITARHGPRLGSLTALIIGLLMGLSVHSANAANQNYLPEERIATFFDMLKNNEIEDAFQQLLAGSYIEKRKGEGVARLSDSVARQFPGYGRILGYEKAEEEDISSTTKRLIYQLNMEHFPLVWEFYFYKPKDQWFLINVSYSDQFVIE